jgi:hypothetical protein
MDNNTKKRLASNDKSFYQTHELHRKQSKRKLGYLFAIGSLVFILIGIVAYAAIKQGGLSNLISGNQDIITNTVNNISESLGGNNTSQSTPTPTEKPIDLPPIPTTQTPKTTQNTNLIVFYDLINSYDITVKPGTTVVFRNADNSFVNIFFDDGRSIALKGGEEKVMYFGNIGNYPFKDTQDDTAFALKGIIRVKN